MAQLSDDCFAHGGKLMTTAEALTLLENKLRCITSTEIISVQDALGRVLSEDVMSPCNVPPHDNSAVDGYAVYFDDLNKTSVTTLPISDRITAGSHVPGTLDKGTAARIFTGAPMPLGADTVLMQEDCTLVETNKVSIPVGIKLGSNRRFAGEDVEQGSVIFRAGRRVRPQDLGLISAIGISKISVQKSLRVAFFSTGDELRNPGTPLESGQVYDSNRYTINGLLKNLGCNVTDLGILPDKPDLIHKALESTINRFDLVLTSGGVSVGEEDHVKQVVESLGSLHAWRLAIKPGRPVALGQIGSTAFVGLPGNPVAVIVTFANFVRPLINLLSGAENVTPKTFPVVAAFAHKKKKDRREWVRVHLRESLDGQWEAHKYSKEGAGVLSSVCHSDGFAVLNEDLLSVHPGDTISYLPFNEIAL
ncbi:molybdopterin biosynthesis protein MoeA [Kiloniella litopenaei]|uniref:Molybdopterin molybdenumtransferase n=1 Tax=Kiloniella litopenaei TaxID=1549748 RepID=A0A0M2RCH8_9PROT|nr:gephyrin-like molybdotransferase Glp [Kiloniella litopenaei]KKJ77695.1 molybdopterin biosynthesis protein MoeA [Kiloniella litopenaei]